MNNFLNRVGLCNHLNHLKFDRVHIHQLIRDSKAFCYYMDTDSMIIDRPIDESLISDELGFLKDELNNEIIEQAYFVAPKVYGLKVSNRVNPIIKAKSIPKNKINFEHMKQLYDGNILTFPVRRLFKDIETLSLLEKSFNVTISRDNTNSKRINIFDKNSVWVNTKPLKINMRMTFYEYLMYKGRFIPKKIFKNLINLASYE